MPLPHVTERPAILVAVSGPASDDPAAVVAALIDAAVRYCPMAGIVDPAALLEGVAKRVRRDEAERDAARTVEAPELALTAPGGAS